jgi:hypothetical protein
MADTESQMAPDGAMAILASQVSVRTSVILHTADANAQSRTRSVECPELAAEVWLNVLKQVDSFTLWVDCHRVCCVFKVEAEKEFMRRHLPGLQLCSTFGNMPALPMVVGVKTGPFLGYSPDNLRATFGSLAYDPFIRAWVSYVATSYTASVTLTPTLVRSHDLDIARCHPSLNQFMVATLGPTVSQAEVPGIQINLFTGEVSFDWMRFLDKQFEQEARLRALRKKEKSSDTREIAEKKPIGSWDRVREGLDEIINVDIP